MMKRYSTHYRYQEDILSFLYIFFFYFLEFLKMYLLVYFIPNE